MSYSIPQKAFDHVRYGHGSPHAYTAELDVKGGSYILHYQYNLNGPGYVYAMYYPDIPEDYYDNEASRDNWHNNVKRVSLSRVPKRDISEWTLSC